MGIMEKKMETTIVYWGVYGDNGKENGNHYSLGFRAEGFTGVPSLGVGA